MEMLARFGLRILIALGVGLLVFVISFLVAYKNYPQGCDYINYKSEKTVYYFNEIDVAITLSKEKNNSLPDSLNQINKKDYHFVCDTDGNILDGWNRPIIYKKIDDQHYSLLSYGQDGKPGGFGPDRDITKGLPIPEETFPSFYQYIFEMNTKQIVNACFGSGVLAFFLCIFTVKLTDLSQTRLFNMGWKIAATMIVTVFFAVIIAALHISISGDMGDHH